MYLKTTVSFDDENGTFCHCGISDIYHESEYFWALNEWRFCPVCGKQHTWETDKDAAKYLLKSDILKNPELKEYIDDYLNGDVTEIYYSSLQSDYLKHADEKIICINDDIFNELVDEIAEEIKVKR